MYANYPQMAQKDNMCVSVDTKRDRPETDKYSKRIETWVKAILKFFIFFFLSFKYKIMLKKSFGAKRQPQSDIKSNLIPNGLEMSV